MPEAASPYKTNWFSKFFECIYLCIAVSVTWSITLEIFVATHMKSPDENSLVTLFLVFRVAAVSTAVLYSIWWHHKERKGNFNSAIKHAWLRGIIRYFIAYEVSIYGFAKILKTQFVIPASMADTPVGSLSGFYLTWNYFGYSHTFAVILGLCQIVGGVLLLFRRTCLLGVFILMPVMVNVVFINIFYSIATGAFINSLIITFALIYLLLLRWTDLKALFFSNGPELPKINFIFLKSIAKLLTIGLAFGVIYSYVVSLRPSFFEGKWKVNEITRNGQPVKPFEWQTDAMVWSNIYFEQNGKVILSPNPYIYEASRANNANYTYDIKSHQLLLNYPGFSEKSDTAFVAVSNYDGKSMQWKFVHNQDTLRYSFLKAETNH